MDLKVYYRKIRELEAQLPDADVVVVSLETPDGGHSGVMSEVPRRIAAKLVVEGRARLANTGEAAEYHEKMSAATQRAQELAEASKLRVEIVNELSTKGRRATKQEKS